MALNYSKEVIKYFLNPVNVGEIKDATAVATLGSPACGDMITLYLKIGKDNKIEDVKFKSFGCASNIATASKMTEMIKGKTIEQAKKIQWKDIADALGGLPNVKVHCSVLAIDTLKEAIKKYEKGDEENKLDTHAVQEALKSVVNPQFGLDIITLKMIREINIQPDEIIIRLKKLDTNPEYFYSIENEVKEHVEELIKKANENKDVKVFFDE